ncbi:MAG: 4-(cytidine 5'-diphospho)-2-C-methyl-D-erythritol kinase [Treponema sp.]|jgi:4-diphosphocytidyl-2-C-methyl-D-erythritol kinase|nr:4-(cytidine 5'-diphospho)-2-C-methyl-D-erythritol kinase [Treponema sp.]
MKAYAPRARTACTIEAPCKINLHLKVKDLRPDGFHELESLFAALAFGDSLSFELAGEDGTLKLEQTCSCGADLSGLAQEKNLVCRALALFREKTGFKAGVRIDLAKRIPLGAGLGGGSSDAASTLLALDRLAGTRLDDRELLEMAAAIGSDAPFFLTCGAAWVTGRGETVETGPVPEGLWTVLVKPPFKSGTAHAFRLLDARRAGQNPETGGSGEFNTREWKKILASPPGEWPFYNDFLPVLPRNGVYRDICRTLKELGAPFSGLSGSGSCCFGIFDDREKAEKAVQSLSGQRNFVQLTFFLARRADRV